MAAKPAGLERKPALDRREAARICLPRLLVLAWIALTVGGAFFVVGGIRAINQAKTLAADVRALGAVITEMTKQNTNALGLIRERDHEVEGLKAELRKKGGRNLK